MLPTRVQNCVIFSLQEVPRLEVSIDLIKFQQAFRPAAVLGDKSAIPRTAGQHFFNRVGIDGLRELWTILKVTQLKAELVSRRLQLYLIELLIEAGKFIESVSQAHYLVTYTRVQNPKLHTRVRHQDHGVHEMSR